MDLRKIGDFYSGCPFNYYYSTKNGHFAHEISYKQIHSDGVPDSKEYVFRSSLMSDLLSAEYECRTFAQALHSIKSRTASLNSQNTEETDSETEEESDYKSKTINTSIDTDKWTVVSDARTSSIDPLVLSAKYAKSEAKLYHKVSALPHHPLRKLFNVLRLDDDWYMRAELIEDCHLRGGCCGQSCGCCRNPANLPHNVLSGHCTPACACCQKRKNTSLTLDDLEYFIEEEKKALESDNPFYLLRMADAYFRYPKRVVETAKTKGQTSVNSSKGSSEPPAYEEKPTSSTSSSRFKWFDLSRFTRKTL